MKQSLGAQSNIGMTSHGSKKIQTATCASLWWLIHLILALCGCQSKREVLCLFILPHVNKGKGESGEIRRWHTANKDERCGARRCRRGCESPPERLSRWAHTEKDVQAVPRWFCQVADQGVYSRHHVVVPGKSQTKSGWTESIRNKRIVEVDL